MSNPRSVNPAPGPPDVPHPDRSGLDYGAYLVAVQACRPTKPSPTGTGSGEASVSSHGGGSLSTVSLGDGGARDGTRSLTRRGGGIRGKVSGLSRSSRRNFLGHMARIDRAALDDSGAKLLFITLTYPGERWPKDPSTCKAHLKAFLKRLERAHGPFAAFWRMGVQARGAWHFHVVLYVWPPFATVGELRRFVSTAWYEACGRICEGHLRYGTRVEEVRYWRKETSYAERYLARREEFPEEAATGRVWGSWREGLLPVRQVVIGVSPGDAYKVRRAYRRLARRRTTGSLTCTTIFVRHENVARLLEFLGYRVG